jgi:hypothetical protein
MIHWNVLMKNILLKPYFYKNTSICYKLTTQVYYSTGTDGSRLLAGPVTAAAIIAKWISKCRFEW